MDGKKTFFDTEKIITNDGNQEKVIQQEAPTAETIIAEARNEWTDHLADIQSGSDNGEEPGKPLETEQQKTFIEQVKCLVAISKGEEKGQHYKSLVTKLADDFSNTGDVNVKTETGIAFFRFLRSANSGVSGKTIDDLVQDIRWYKSRMKAEETRKSNGTKTPIHEQLAPNEQRITGTTKIEYLGTRPDPESLYTPKGLAQEIYTLLSKKQHQQANLTAEEITTIETMMTKVNSPWFDKDKNKGTTDNEKKELRRYNTILYALALAQYAGLRDCGYTSNEITFAENHGSSYPHDAERSATSLEL